MSTGYVVMSVIGGVILALTLGYFFVPFVKEELLKIKKAFSKAELKKYIASFKSGGEDQFHPEEDFAAELNIKNGLKQETVKPTVAEPENEAKQQPEQVLASEPEPEVVKEKKVRKPFPFREKVVSMFGTPLHLFNAAPKSVQTKRYSLSIIAIMVIVVSTIIAGIVNTSVFGMLALVPVMIAWFFIMTSITRGIFSAFENIWAGMIMKGKVPKRICKQTLPLITISVALFLTVASINTVLFSMMVFRNEISVRIDQSRAGRLSQTMVDMDARIAPLEAKKAKLEETYQNLTKNWHNQIDIKTKAINDLQTSIISQREKLNKEVAGDVGAGLSGIKNDGPAAKQKRATIEANELTLQQMKNELIYFKNNPDPAIAQALADRDKSFIPINQQIETIRNEQKANAAKIGASKLDGLIDRYNAMLQVAEHNPFFKLYLFLFLAIELMVFFFKMAFGYDAITVAMAGEISKAEHESYLSEKKRYKQADADHKNAIQKIYVQSVENTEANKQAFLAATNKLYAANISQIDALSLAIEELKKKVDKLEISEDDKKKLIEQHTSEYLLWTKESSEQQKRLLN